VNGQRPRSGAGMVLETESVLLFSHESQVWPLIGRGVAVSG
jgi:hypothetical protein